MTPEELREYNREKMRAWRAKNLDRVRAQGRARYEAKRETEVARLREWRRANPEMVREQKRRQRAKEDPGVRAARTAAYYRANRESLAEKQKARYEVNRDERLTKRRKSRIVNADREREQQQRQYWGNVEHQRERAKVSANKRRALTVGDLTTDQWYEVLEEFDNCCAYCQARDVSLAIEHVVPLSRGGRHTKGNVVPACKSCNSSKGAKSLLEFAAIVPIKLRV
jgi:5-methylcytosine-specific restriction endonuclease McrA